MPHFCLDTLPDCLMKKRETAQTEKMMLDISGGHEKRPTANPN